MMGTKLPESYNEFVEVDPTGRYGRYSEILGKGASKTVYRAFDEFEGIEVAWNQVKLNDFLQSPEDLERLYCEIHLLKTLKHKNIMKFYTSWVDTSNRNINFVTEMFTSGTLRQYRQKHKRVNIRAVKHWCRQILRGLLYLHSHDPPVIHRDLKCDNIFVNGNQGEVKIGDLGLAAILRKSHAAHCVGTPEFMAPEVYEEEYNELVDIYSFGMCLLEMVTFEYPYSECSHPVQIYKKVISGKKPQALYKVTDLEVRQFVEKCLVTVSRRIPARELLKDPFLQIDDCGSDSRLIECRRDVDEIGPHLRQPYFDPHHSDGWLVNGVPNDLRHEMENGWDYHLADIEPHGIELFSSHEDELQSNVDITIKGKMKDDDSIFLRLRIADKEGRIRNIYFPFDMETDTALSVATEMVAELDITDQDVTKIADMIDGEISSLVPEWKPGPGIEESPGLQGFCHNCASNGSSSGSLLEYLSSNNIGTKNLQVVQCSCAAMHGRFEEITYQVEGSEQCVTEGAPVISSQSDGPQYMDIWARHEGHDLSSLGSRDAESDQESEQLDQKVDESAVHINSHIESHSENSASQTCNNSNGRQAIGDLDDRAMPPIVHSSAYTFSHNYENEIRQELRWLKAKYLMELRELSNQQFGGNPKASSLPTALDSREQRIANGVIDHSASVPLEGDSFELFLKSYALGKHLSSYFPSHDSKNFDTANKKTPAGNNGGCCRNSCPDFETQRAQNREANEEYSPDHMITAKNFYAGFLVPHSIHRTRSLPVDAVDV